MSALLPMNNRCKKCGEPFHTVHVCEADLLRAMRNCCDHCDDGDGHSVFPYYGVAPHTHDTSRGWIGSTRLKPREDWGCNFREDPECPGQGVYMRCPACGRGEPSQTAPGGPSEARGPDEQDQPREPTNG